MNLFQNAKFFTTVNHLKDLPDTGAEIAFVLVLAAAGTARLRTDIEQPAWQRRLSGEKYPHASGQAQFGDENEYSCDERDAAEKHRDDQTSAGDHQRPNQNRFQ